MKRSEIDLRNKMQKAVILAMIQSKYLQINVKKVK
jgi:hypothetical protein